jgi:hypothetical protein
MLPTLVIFSHVAGALAFATPARRLTEIAPLKAAMLVKNWQGLLQEVDQKVGVVPELGSTSVGVKRFGPELERRTMCKRQFERFYESTYGLAMADKSADAAARRELLSSLDIAGAKRGPRCAVYATIASPASMALCERLDDEWSILALIVNPTERAIPAIVDAERGALEEIRKQAESSGAELRVHADVKPTLAGDLEQLALSQLGTGDTWYRCQTGSA